MQNHDISPAVMCPCLCSYTYAVVGVECVALSLALQASAADNGQCLVHDVNSFGSNGVVNGLINHVACANVSSGESRDAVKAIAWHPDLAGLLLLGTESGEGGAERHRRQGSWHPVVCWWASSLSGWARLMLRLGVVLRRRRVPVRAGLDCLSVVVAVAACRAHCGVASCQSSSASQPAF